MLRGCRRGGERVSSALDVAVLTQANPDLGAQREQTVCPSSHSARRISRTLAGAVSSVTSPQASPFHCRGGQLASTFRCAVAVVRPRYQQQIFTRVDDPSCHFIICLLFQPGTHPYAHHFSLSIPHPPPSTVPSLIAARLFDGVGRQMNLQSRASLILIVSFHHDARDISRVPAESDTFASHSHILLH